MPIAAYLFAASTHVVFESDDESIVEIATGDGPWSEVCRAPCEADIEVADGTKVRFRLPEDDSADAVALGAASGKKLRIVHSDRSNTREALIGTAVLTGIVGG